MKKIKLGFVPAHREPFDAAWAAEMRKRCIAAFAGISQIDVIVPDEKLTGDGCVRNDEDADKAIYLFNENEIDGLIIGTMTFGDEVAALKVAGAFNDLPVFLFGTKEGDFTADGGRRSDAFCGTLSISSGLHRRHINFTFGGLVFPEEPEFLEAVTDFARVCSIYGRFIGAQVGLVGPRPERFETCIFSEDEMMKQFDQRVVPVSLPDIMKMADPEGENGDAIKMLVQDMTGQVDVSRVAAGTLGKLAGLEYALTQFATDKKLSAMGVQCWNAMQEVYGISPCYAMGRMTDKGIMTACEVDVYGSLTMLVQYLANFSENVPHFIDWTIKHQEIEDTFLAWHCGNAPPSLKAESVNPIVKEHSILGQVLGLDRSQGTIEFQLKEGIVTLCRLQEHDGDFKMLITNGEAVHADQDLRGSWSWIKVDDLDYLYETLIAEGFVHHASLIHGDCSEAIIDACTYLGIEPVIV